MIRQFSKKIRRRLAKTLAATLVVGWPLSVSAVEQVPISRDGKQIFDVYYYDVADVNETILDFFRKQLDDSINYAVYNLTPNIKAGLNKAFLWWAEIIGPGAIVNQPAQYFVNTADFANASASYFSYLNQTETQNPNLFSEIFQNGRVVGYFSDLNALALDETTAQKAYGLILIGQNIGVDEHDGQYGFVNAADYAFQLPESITGIDIAPVMFHEIGHSLGLSADRQDNPFDIKYSDEEGANKLLVFGDGAANPLNYTSHLRDQFGRQPLAGMYILTPEMFDDEFIRNSYLAATGTPLSADNVFFVSNVNGIHDRAGRTGLYFVGDNVSQVLDGKTFTTLTGEQVSGVPINMWEGSFPEFSHPEMARSMMSHQDYRSYTNFLEVELAMMQDIGYNIDRKNFYGRSIYTDGQTLVNDQVFSARLNGQYVDGYNSSTMGIGLHVFGSNNDVTQRGDIWTNGYAGAGIRVDGLNDKITVAQGTQIHSDGTIGKGVLVAYGKNHNVTIDGTVTANGERGSAVEFDFGANTLGGTVEFRGSYFRYVRNVIDGQIISAENYALNEMCQNNDDYSITDPVNGDTNAPMASLTVNGTLSAKNGNAIYIAEESFVDRIDINAGAQIEGNIVSRWKQFDPVDDGIFTAYGTTTYQGYDDGNPVTQTGDIEPLFLQYKGGNYLFDQYIPDLVTQLNFNAAGGDIFYNGNISGFDNIKLNVTGGGVFYGGFANVVSVNVAGGAQLFGGIYNVNDMTARMATGFADPTTGKFINHGTIGAMTIGGTLLSDGTFQGIYGYPTANIFVNGSVYVEGSTALATNMLPHDATAILTATGGVSGNLRNSLTPVPTSALMSQTSSIVGNSVVVTAQTANNVGNLNRRQSEALNAADDMSRNLLNDSRREQLRPLYDADSATAAEILDQLGTSNAPQMMSHVQKNSLVNRLLADRFAAKNSDDIWVKFTKDWGKLYGGDKFHGQAISVGWDKNFGDKWRGGVFVSYNATSLERGNIYDTRGGLYGGWHSGADEALIYVDGGQVRNKLSRTISGLGLGTSAKYRGTIFEIGGEYKRDLTPDKSYHVSPFINLQASTLRQNSFSESGAGIYNQHVHAKTNNYFAGQLGLEYKKNFAHGNFRARIGVSHAFAGAEPELRFSYEGGNNSYRLRNRQDKTHFVLSLGGENEFAKDWTFGGEIFLKHGSHDRDLSASLFLRKVW